MKIRAIPREGGTGVCQIPLSPPDTAALIIHRIDHMVINGPGAHERPLFSGDDLVRGRADIFIYPGLQIRLEVTPGVLRVAGISAFFLPGHFITDINLLSAVFGAESK